MLVTPLSKITERMPVLLPIEIAPTGSTVGREFKLQVVYEHCVFCKIIERMSLVITPSPMFWFIVS